MAALQSVQPRPKVGERRHVGVRTGVGVGHLVGISAKIIEFADVSRPRDCFVLNVLICAVEIRIYISTELREQDTAGAEAEELSAQELRQLLQ